MFVHKRGGLRGPGPEKVRIVKNWGVVEKWQKYCACAEKKISKRGTWTKGGKRTKRFLTYWSRSDPKGGNYRNIRVDIYEYICIYIFLYSYNNIRKKATRSHHPPRHSRNCPVSVLCTGAMVLQMSKTQCFWTFGKIGQISRACAEKRPAQNITNTSRV